MWEERAHRARRDIAALAAAGLSVSELHAAAIRVIGDEVSADLTCWAAIDPETLVISTMVSGETRIPPEYEPRLAEAEYSANEPHTFAAGAHDMKRVTKEADSAWLRYGPDFDCLEQGSDPRELLLVLDEPQVDLLLRTLRATCSISGW